MADIWKYFADRERELRECSLHIPDEDGLRFIAEPDEEHGKLYGAVGFDGYPSDVFLAVHESIAPRGNGFTRDRYAYYLVIHGQEIGAYERHDTHDPPVHKHCSRDHEHELMEADVVSFKEAVEEAWRFVSERARPSEA